MQDHIVVVIIAQDRHAMLWEQQNSDRIKSFQRGTRTGQFKSGEKFKVVVERPDFQQNLIGLKIARFEGMENVLYAMRPTLQAMIRP